MLHWNPKVSSLHPVNLYIVLASSVIAGVDLNDSPLQAAQPQAQSLELIETIVKQGIKDGKMPGAVAVSYTHLRAHETDS